MPDTALTPLTGLIEQINQINQRAQQQANAGRIPGGAGLESESSGNISRALAGELDPSVLMQLGQQSAQRGVMSGSPGGPSTNADYLRSLGLNSLDLMNQGQNWLTQATARNPGAPIYNAGNQVLTAEQRAQQEMENKRLALEQQRLNQQASLGTLTRGGGGLGGGGSVAGGTRTGGGGGAAINWGDLFDSNTSLSTTFRDTNTADPGQLAWGNNTGSGGGWLTSPSGGNMSGGSGLDNWATSMLGSGGNLAGGGGGADDPWDPFYWASDDNTGTAGAYDFNLDPWAGYG